ncbi:cytochrome c oxidase subunit 8A, mitochondrial [Loxodonta africana]|uniref:Cytochrome c oxidase subunit 8 n=1 Tax=Loxodonta africana TaxID=9785 RepID=G3T786_LOXAF|nr:cytochrome c oxidase subunit 8A, mitochondrial [Loxodonta africana]XP_049748280.1 cytochrome c oxidase subunit 8A, mitochondrial [Elephas maximus indicus]
MSALTPLLLRGLTGSARRVLLPRAQIHSKPPREPLGTTDCIIALTSCFLCFLVPPAWIMTHLDSYRKRE